MLGLTELRRRRFQFTLIALVVTLVSYLVLMVNGLGVGLNQQAGSALRSFDANAIAYGERANLSLIRSELSADSVARVGEEGGVEALAPIGYQAANVQEEDGDVRSAAFIGFDPSTIGEPELVRGRALEPGEDRAVLADKEFLRLTGYQLGDTVPVEVRLQEFEFSIVGVIDEGSFFFQPVLYVTREAWREIKYGTSADSAPAASVVLLQGNDLAGKRGEGFEIVSRETAFQNIEGVAGQQATVAALRVFGYLIGALVIGAFFYVLTLQKEPQLGMLKALGASSGYLFRQLALQALVITSLGVAISVPLGVATAEAISRIPDPVPVAFDPATYIVTSLVLVSTGLVGSLLSAWRIARVDPLMALGQQT